MGELIATISILTTAALLMHDTTQHNRRTQELTKELQHTRKKGAKRAVKHRTRTIELKIDQSKYKYL